LRACGSRNDPTSIVIRPLEDADHDTWEEQFCAYIRSFVKCVRGIDRVNVDLFFAFFFDADVNGLSEFKVLVDKPRLKRDIISIGPHTH